MNIETSKFFTLHLLVLLFVASVMIVSVQPLSAQTDLFKQLYEDKARFNQLSGAAQSVLERKYGPNAQAVTSGTALPLLPLNAGAPLSAVQVNAADTTIQDTQSETSVVLGASGVVLVAYNDSSKLVAGAPHFTGYSRSTNGGTTFTGMPALPSGANGDAGDPVFARDNVTGRIYLSTLQFNGSGIPVMHSDDNGLTFSAPTQGAPGTTGDQDKSWIAVDNFPGPGQGNVYLGWRDFGPSNAMRFTRSTDGGLTFGPSGGVVMNAGGQGAFVAVGPDHSVYYFFYAGTSIQMRKSTDLGLTFAPAVLVGTITGGVNGDLGLNGGFRTNSFPHAAVNPVNGNIYVVYNQPGVGVDKADVFLQQSTNGGATWAARVRVNDDVSTRDQWMPTISVSPNGQQLAVGFYDRRNDPANSMIDRYAAIAKISGSTLTWNPNQRVTTQNFPAVIGQDPVVNTTYMGDYDQIVSDAGKFYMPWGDNTNATVFHMHQPDVFFATLAGTQPPTLAKSFTPSTVAVNDRTTLAFTITNPNQSTALTGLSFTDTLPLGLRVASFPNASNSCGGTFSAAAGATSLSLTGGSVAAGTSCTLRVDLIALSTGTKNNATSAIHSTEGGNGNSASASLVVTKAATQISAFSSVTTLSGSSYVQIRITALVMANPGPVKPTGTVEFRDSNNVLLGSVPLGSNGSATLTFYRAKPVNLTIYVNYKGDNNFFGSSFGPIIISNK